MVTAYVLTLGSRCVWLLHWCVGHREWRDDGPARCQNSQSCALSSLCEIPLMIGSIREIIHLYCDHLMLEWNYHTLWGKRGSG